MRTAGLRLMRWLGKHAARTAPSLGRIAQRSASVRLSARVQPMSARQKAKPSAQTARDLKFQNFRTFRCRDLSLCGSRFCRRKYCSTAPKPHAASRAFRAFTAASGALIMLRLKLALSMTTPRGTSPHAFCLKRQGLIIFIGNSERVKLRTPRLRRFHPRSVL